MPVRLEYKKEYQRQWHAARRAAYFAGKSCAICGSTDRLELDHVDPSTKISHSIWSWSQHRREKELSKCQALCSDCHKQKTIQYNRFVQTGVPNLSLRKLTDQSVEEIRALLYGGLSEIKVAAMFGVGKTTVHTIKTGQLYVQPKNGLGPGIPTQDLLVPSEAD